MKVDLPLLFPLTVALSAFQRSMGATLSYQPPEFKSEGGLLEVTLTVDLLESLNGQRLASAYNGEPIGPTLRVSPGDKLVVHLENNLETTAVDQELHEYSLDPTNDMINRTIIVNRLSSIGNVYDPAFGFWGLNYVNLHFHGMEFSPSLEMLMEEWVEGGGKKTYVFDIPQDKEPGLNWYHNHVHGTAAHAYMSSLFGFIIVEGTDADITSAPGIDGATEVLMLMSEFWPNGSGLAPPFLPIAYATNWLSVVNGHLAAETNYQVEQGETLLFRVVSATVEPTIRIVAPGITFIVLADDGQPLPEPVATDTVVVEAGGRKDFIVRFDTPGEYNFTRLPWGTAFAPDEEACLANFGPPPMESIPVHPCISYDIEAPLATVVVTESNASAIARVEDSSLIDSIQLPEISDRYKALMNQEHVAEKTVTFDQAVGFPLFDIPYDGPFVPPGVGFGINSHFFVPGAIEDNVTEGTCELWHVVSNPAGMEHTFHAHGCKFVVLSYDGEPNESPTWVDTEMIPGANMTIHICFDRLQAGDEFPVHCHAPSHQDIGMMAMYSVVAAGDEEGETSGALDRTPVTVLLTVLVGFCLLAFPLL